MIPWSDAQIRDAAPFEALGSAAPGGSLLASRMTMGRIIIRLTTLVVLLGGIACRASSTGEADLAVLNDPIAPGNYQCRESLAAYCATTSGTPETPCSKVSNFSQAASLLAIENPGFQTAFKCGAFDLVDELYADAVGYDIYDPNSGQLTAVLGSVMNSAPSCAGGPSTLSLPRANCLPFSTGTDGG
jgi:hypothetical protein